MGKGVYQIRNTVNDKRYIGGTITSFERRWYTHRTTLESGDHHCIALQRAWNKYGADAFAFEVIEEVSNEDVLSREQYWMDYYRPSGIYNSLPEAGSRRGNVLTEHHLQSLKRAREARWARPGERERMAEKLRQRWADPKQREKNLAAIRSAPVSDEQKAAHSRSARAHWADPEARRKNTEATRTARSAPESRQKSTEAMRRRWESTEQRQCVTDALAKEYAGFVSPDGTIYAPVKNLRAFCRDHGLTYSEMNRLANGTRPKSKGWTRYEPKEGIE